jgi:hypothetical protein
MSQKFQITYGTESRNGRMAAYHAGAVVFSPDCSNVSLPLSYSYFKQNVYNLKF